MDLGALLGMGGGLNTPAPEQGSDLTAQWDAYLREPSVQAGLLQFGLSALQPLGYGQSQMGHIAQSIGSGFEASDRAKVGRSAEATQKRKLDLDEEQIKESGRQRGEDRETRISEGALNRQAQKDITSMRVRELDVDKQRTVLYRTAYTQGLRSYQQEVKDSLLSGTPLTFDPSVATQRAQDAAAAAVAGFDALPGAGAGAVGGTEAAGGTGVALKGTGATGAGRGTDTLSSSPSGTYPAKSLTDDGLRKAVSKGWSDEDILAKVDESDREVVRKKLEIIRSGVYQKPALR